MIRSITQTEQERRPDEMPSYIGSPQYRDQRGFSDPLVGPVLGITFGKGQTTQTFVGAAGSETMRRRILQISYEVTVSFDDGRFGLIEVAGHRRPARGRPRARGRLAPGAGQEVALTPAGPGAIYKLQAPLAC